MKNSSKPEMPWIIKDINIYEEIVSVDAIG
jgi:hypothetical protein